MNDLIRGMLDEEIGFEFENLKSLQSGSQEQTIAVDNLAKLYKLGIEDEKVRNEDNDRRENRRIEERNNANQLASDFNNREREDSFRIKRLVIDGAAIVLPLVCYGIWMHRGFKFEETGVISSSTFRNLLGKIRPNGV